MNKPDIKEIRKNIHDEDYLFNLINITVENNYYGTKKFDLSKQKNQFGENLMSNAIFIEMMNIKQSRPQEYEEKLNRNPYLLIAEATKKAKGREFVKSTQEVDLIDASTHKKTGLKTLPNKSYIDGQEFYNNLIKDNGLAIDFMKAAKIGVYGKKEKVEGTNLFKTDTISIRFENFVQGITNFDYPIGYGKTASATLHKYKGKYGDVYIVEEESTGGILFFKSMIEIKAHYGIERL